MATQARFEASPCGIFSEQSGSVTGFFPEYLVFRLSAIPLRFDAHTPMSVFYPGCSANLGTDGIVKHNEFFLLGKVWTASFRLVYLRADLRT